jgi:hypothetical protein
MFRRSAFLRTRVVAGVVLLGGTMALCSSCGTTSARATQGSAGTEWTDNGSPLEFQPRVVSMDWNSGDYRPPYSYQEIQPTNAYQSADGNTELEIFVGASGEDPSNGIFIRRITNLTGDAGFKDSKIVLAGSGAVAITGFKGDLVFWKSASGKIGTYLLPTSDVAFNQPPDARGWPPMEPSIESYPGLALG